MSDPDISSFMDKIQEFTRRDASLKRPTGLKMSTETWMGLRDRCQDMTPYHDDSIVGGMGSFGGVPIRIDENLSLNEVLPFRDIKIPVDVMREWNRKQLESIGWDGEGVLLK